MNKDKINIILYDLFDELKKEGVSLDLKQLEAFMELLTVTDIIAQKRTYEEKKKAILHMTKALWLTKKEFQTIFERKFEIHFEAFATSAGFFVDEKSEVINENRDVKEPEKKLKEPETIDEPDDKNNPIQPEKTPSESEEHDQDEKQEIYLNFKEGKGGGEETNPPIGSLSESKFIFSDEKHLPISTRKAKQIFKKLLNGIPLNTKGDIDIGRTVEKIAKEQIIIKPEFKQKKEFKREVLLLVDHRGAMIAFDDWVEQLKEVITLGRKHHNLKTYYFYNMPYGNDEDDYLVFKTQAHITAFRISELAKRVTRETEIIIFSDAGVMDNITDHEKVNAFYESYTILKRKTEKILWINPFPKNKWENGATKMLSALIPMVSYNEAGIKEGIKTLLK